VASTPLMRGSLPPLEDGEHWQRSGGEQQGDFAVAVYFKQVTAAASQLTRSGVQ